MKILHYYPTDPQGVIAPYVIMLCEGMGLECTNERTPSASEAMQHLRNSHYDILHIHGCWHNSLWRIGRTALSAGTRLVVSPHGQLEPWVAGQNYWKEKLPKTVAYQRGIVRRAYAVVVQGKMEEECIRRLGWNPRTVVVRNCLVTQSTTRRDMTRQHFLLYRRVMDSNPLELMTDSTRLTLRQLLKAGITGDARWLREQCVNIADPDQWRLVYCYARQEHIEDVVRQGLQLLRLDAPDMDISQSECFQPAGYEESEPIERAIGMQFETENKRLIATFRHLRKLAQHRTLAISHLVELDRELRYHDADEDLLAEQLQERRLDKLAGRIMQLMAEQTGLDEGYMPVAPISDRTTRRMRQQIENHLKI